MREAGHRAAAEGKAQEQGGVTGSSPESAQNNLRRLPGALCGKDSGKTAGLIKKYWDRFIMSAVGTAWDPSGMRAMC